MLEFEEMFRHLRALALNSEVSATSDAFQLYPVESVTCN